MYIDSVYRLIDTGKSRNVVEWFCVAMYNKSLPAIALTEMSTEKTSEKHQNFIKQRNWRFLSRRGKYKSPKPSPKPHQNPHTKNLTKNNYENYERIMRGL